ncbi:MAG: Npun_F5749 family FMN-dependent PPOX-type flavoprotein [Cyanobacteria bacterium P01_C01_bin.118]
MTLDPWRPALARALHRNRAKSHCRYLQLATLNHQGKPSNRTLVFRGFVDADLRMITDGRSEKVQQLQNCPWAEICWYFTVTREQFRIAGKLTIVDTQDPEDIRLNAWQSISANARQQFYWPDPGQPRDDAVAFEAKPPETLEGTPPDSFYVLLLTADRVEHLALRGNPQDRHVYERVNNQWTMQTVNP